MNRSAPRSINQYLDQLREQLAALGDHFGWWGGSGHVQLNPAWLQSLWALPLLMLAGLLLLTVLLHLARGVGRLHGLLAKALLVYRVRG